MAGYIGSKSSVTLVDGYTEAEADAEFVNDPNDVITVSGSNVGIDTSSPQAGIDVESSAKGIFTSGNVYPYPTGNAYIKVKGTNAEHNWIGITGGYEQSSGSANLMLQPNFRLTNEQAGNYIGSEAQSVTTADITFGKLVGGSSTSTNATKSEFMRIDSSGNVGIGTSSMGYPAYADNLTIADTANAGITIRSGTSNEGNIYFSDATGTGTGTYAGYISYLHATNALNFATPAGVSMTIDSSGNLLVGKTATGGHTAGMQIINGSFFSHVRDGGVVQILNRKSSDGDILSFEKDNTAVGVIGTNGGRVYIESSGGANLVGIEFSTSGTAMTPRKNSVSSDNEVDVGSATYRWDDIYATNGTIQTSDFNEKQDIASLTATEMLVGKRISTLFKTFRWKDSVAENGDSARTHTGVIAQDVQAAFTAEGLDAGDYALFISSTWWETQTEVPAVEAVEAVDEVTETTTDEDGNEVVTVITEAVEAVEAKDAYTRTDTYETEAEAPEGATEKTRLGIRYPELLSFVAAYNEQRFASIEARLTALEA